MVNFKQTTHKNSFKFKKKINFRNWVLKQCNVFFMNSNKQNDKVIIITCCLWLLLLVCYLTELSVSGYISDFSNTIVIIKLAIYYFSIACMFFRKNLK